MASHLLDRFANQSESVVDRFNLLCLCVSDPAVESRQKLAGSIKVAPEFRKDRKQLGTRAAKDGDGRRSPLGRILNLCDCVGERLKLHVRCAAGKVRDVEAQLLQSLLGGLAALAGLGDGHLCSRKGSGKRLAGRTGKIGGDLQLLELLVRKPKRPA